MVRIICLNDNITNSPVLCAKHGLSLYVETSKHKLLFDVGPDDTFFQNANKLEIDLTKVDSVIISHGHYDHGGGLEHFIKLNPQAKIYIRCSAFEPHYSLALESNRYIGLESGLREYPNMIFSDDNVMVDTELSLFSSVSERKLFSETNKYLLAEKNNVIIPDDFCHEQYLVVTDGEHQILFSGCSHAGIVNIVEKFQKEFQKRSNVTVIGGFHLYDVKSDQYENEDHIDAVSDALMASGLDYYTCHCTGIKAYERMKNKMREKLSYIAVGDEIVIG